MNIFIKKHFVFLVILLKYNIVYLSEKPRFSTRQPLIRLPTSCFFYNFTYKTAFRFPLSAKTVFRFPFSAFRLNRFPLSAKTVFRFLEMLNFAENSTPKNTPKKTPKNALRKAPKRAKNAIS